MRRTSFLAIAVAVLLLASCSQLGGLGDLGGILGSPSVEQPSDVRGTVANIDTNARRIDLNVSYVNNLRDDRSGQAIYYDDRTRVVYQDREYNVQDLERGDEIGINGVNDGGRYVARTITVLRDSTR